MMELAQIQTTLPRLYQVRRRWHEIRDTVSLALEPVDGGEVPAFATGQFNMLYIFGAGEIPVSISGHPLRARPLLHTIRAVGAVSRALCQLKAGETLGVRGPFGSHWPLDQAEGKDMLIVAGGLGLAPLRSTLYQIAERRAKYGRVTLIYGARTPADILYAREIAHWRARLDFEIKVTVDAAPGDWRGNVGVVTRIIPRVACDPSNTLAFLCGPEIMMRFSALELTKRGLTPEQIYVSLERNMQCATGWCGHCQFAPYFVCKDGPIFPYHRVQRLLNMREV